LPTSCWLFSGLQRILHLALWVRHFLVGQATLEGFFGIAFWTLFFFIPALTMRLLAEEKKTGTIEMLLTKAVTDWEVVIGKFLSTFCWWELHWRLHSPTSSHLPISVIWTWPGSVWLCRIVADQRCLISIGLYASSITNNQIVAF